MPGNLVARAAVAVRAPSARVWNALLDPQAIKQYFFGATVVTDWEEGGKIVWKGEWQGKPYEDRGVIRRVIPERTLEYMHFSPLSGLPDRPEHYHLVTIQLAPEGNGTRISLTQDNNPTEQARDHSEKNWSMVLEGLKKYVEG